MKRNWGIVAIAALAGLACGLVWYRIHQLELQVSGLYSIAVTERARRIETDRIMRETLDEMRHDFAAKSRALRAESQREIEAREEAARERTERRLETERRRIAARLTLEETVASTRAAFESAARNLVRAERRWVPTSAMVEQLQETCDRAQKHYDAAVAALEEFDRLAAAASN